MNLREAAGDDLDIAMHCLAQFDTRSAVGLCKAIEPSDPLWIEDPIRAHYSEAWLELKRSTRVPVLTGERLELTDGFRPFLDHQVVDMIHPDTACAGGISACRKIADYAARFAATKKRWPRGPLPRSGIAPSWCRKVQA